MTLSTNQITNITNAATSAATTGATVNQTFSQLITNLESATTDYGIVAVADQIIRTPGVPGGAVQIAEQIVDTVQNQKDPVQKLLQLQKAYSGLTALNTQAQQSETLLQKIEAIL